MEIGKSAALLDANSINVWPITNANNLYYIETKGETTASGTYLYPITGNYIGLWNGTTNDYSWTSIDIMDSANDTNYKAQVANNNSVITGIGIRKVPRNTGLSTSSSNEGKIVPEQRFAGIVYQTDTKSNIVSSGLNTDANKNVIRGLIRDYLNSPSYFDITGDIEIEQRTPSNSKETLKLKAKTLSSVNENPAKTKMSLYQGKTLRFGGDSGSSYTSEFNAMEGSDVNASSQSGMWTSSGNWLKSKNAGGIYKRPSWKYTESGSAGSNKTNIFAWISDIDYLVGHYDASINAINNTLSTMNGTIGGLMGEVSFAPTSNSENIYQTTSNSVITYHLNTTLKNLTKVTTDILESRTLISAKDITASGNITASNGTITGQNVTVSNLLTSKDITSTNSIQGKNITVSNLLTSKDIISTNSIQGKNITTTGSVTVGNTLIVKEGGERIEKGDLVLDKGNIKCHGSASSIDVSTVNCREINLRGSSSQFLLGNGLSKTDPGSTIPIKIKLRNTEYSTETTETVNTIWNNAENAYCATINLSSSLGIPIVETPDGLVVSNTYLKNIEWIKYGNIINISGIFQGVSPSSNDEEWASSRWPSGKIKGIGYHSGTSYSNEIQTIVWVDGHNGHNNNRGFYFKIKWIPSSNKLSLCYFSPDNKLYAPQQNLGFNITFIAY